MGMVPDHDWLANFKPGITVGTWNILMFISFMYFSEVVGMVFPDFVQFFQNYLAFICAVIPGTIVQVKKHSSAGSCPNIRKTGDSVPLLHGNIL